MDRIAGISNEPLQSLSPAQTKTPNLQQEKFSTILKSAIEEVNNAQLASDQKTEAFAQGEIEDLHDVMVTAQKATVTLETAVQVQRKVIDAYNETMRMQI